MKGCGSTEPGTAINLHLKVSLPLPQAMGMNTYTGLGTLILSELPDTHTTPSSKAWLHPNYSSLLQLGSQTEGFPSVRTNKPEVKVEMMTFALAFCKIKSFYTLVLPLSVKKKKK